MFTSIPDSLRAVLEELCENPIVLHCVYEWIDRSEYGIREVRKDISALMASLIVLIETFLAFLIDIHATSNVEH